MFLAPVIRTYLQTVNSGYDPQGNGLAERWVGIIKVRATALLADIRLPPQNWSYACRWVAYVHTHRVTEKAINETLPQFGGVCLGHDNRIAGGVLVVSVVNGVLREVCSAKVSMWAKRQDKHGDSMCTHKNKILLKQLMLIAVVKSSEIEVPTVWINQRGCYWDSGCSWTWLRMGLYVNDLRAFLPAWESMDSPKSPSPRLMQMFHWNRFPCKQRMLTWNSVYNFARDRLLSPPLGPLSMSPIGLIPMPWLWIPDLSLGLAGGFE